MAVYHLLSICHRGGSKKPQWLEKLIKTIGIINVRCVVIFGAGIVYYKYDRPNVDYRKYFGPDWKATYENASTIIGNHSSWIDT